MAPLESHLLTTPPALPGAEERWEDQLAERTGHMALLLLSTALWLSAAGTGHAAWSTRHVVPVSPYPHASPLLIATHEPILDVDPLPGMNAEMAVMPSAGEFIVNAGTLLAKDEAQSALLKMRLVHQAATIVTSQLK